MSAGESPIYVIMGVSGSGKSTVGQALARVLDCPFYDGDDFHPAENVAKMGRGKPLTDADRAPWLARLAALIQDHLDSKRALVLACSALKQRYREQLKVDSRIRFVFLDGDFDLIWQRMSARQEHYMKVEMLRSQFDALEPPGPGEALSIRIEQNVDAIAEQILQSTWSDVEPAEE